MVNGILFTNKNRMEFPHFIRANKICFQQVFNINYWSENVVFTQLTTLQKVAISYLSCCVRMN